MQRARLGVAVTLLLGVGASSACSTNKGSSAPAVQARAGASATGATPVTTAASGASGTTASAAVGTAGTVTTGMAGTTSANAQAGVGGSSGVAGSSTHAGADAGASRGEVAAAGGGGASGAAGAAGAGDATCNMTIPSSMDCTAKLAPGDERTCMLGTRKYIVHAGKTMNPCQPVALVIDAHGATETAEEQLGRDKFCAGSICWMGLGSGWAAESDMPGGGFIAVFPQGINNMWQASDADFMVMLVDEMKKLANIDPKKVYMSGISNGGFLTYQTGCPHSDVFHGMAPHSGGSNCTGALKQPIPLIAFDAMADFAYSSNVDASNTVVKLNNCQGDAKPWLTIDSTYTEPVCRTANEDPMAKLIPCTQVMGMIKPTTCKIWDQCDGGVKVAFCEVAPNTEHGTSNAATDAHIIYENATQLNTPSIAWRFFKTFW